MNLLQRAGMDAQRVLLRATLRASGYSLSETARRLEMIGPSGAVQAQLVQERIARLGLKEWFEEHRAAHHARVRSAA